MPNIKIRCLRQHRCAGIDQNEIFEVGDTILLSEERAETLEGVSWEYAPKNAKLVRNPVSFQSLDANGQLTTFEQEDSKVAEGKRTDFTDLDDKYGGDKPSGPSGTKPVTESAPKAKTTSRAKTSPKAKATSRAKTSPKAKTGDE